MRRASRGRNEKAWQPGRGREVVSGPLVVLRVPGCWKRQGKTGLRGRRQRYGGAERARRQTGLDGDLGMEQMSDIKKR